MASGTVKAAAAEGRRYGWKPSAPDVNDRYHYAAPAALAAAPPQYDPRERWQAVYDQGSLGSCVAESMAGIHQYTRRKHGMATWVPSSLFVYWCARNYDGTVNQDAGTTIRTGMKVLVKLGACPEETWPRDFDRWREKPSAKAFEEAERAQAVKYARVQRSLPHMKALLASDTPIAFGFTVYDSFESEATARTGIVPMPRRGERAQGGHAVVAIGYDDYMQSMLVRNSWGKRWGLNGHCWMPYQFFLDQDLSADFWALESIEGAPEPGPTPGPTPTPTPTPTPNPPAVVQKIGPFTIHSPARAGDFLSLSLD